MRDADGKKVFDENGNEVVHNVLLPYVAEAVKRRTFAEDVILTAKALKLQRERGMRIRVYHEENGLNPDIPFEMRPPGGDNESALIWQAAVDLLDNKPFKDRPRGDDVVRPAPRPRKAPAAPKAPKAPALPTSEQARGKELHEYVKGLTEESDYENDYQFKGYTVGGARMFVYDKANSNQVRIAWDPFAQGWQVDFTGPLSPNNEVFADLNEAGEHALSFLDDFRKNNPNYGEKLQTSTGDVIPPDPTDASSVNPAGPNFNLNPAPEAPVVEDKQSEPELDNISFDDEQAKAFVDKAKSLFTDHVKELFAEIQTNSAVAMLVGKIESIHTHLEEYYDIEDSSHLIEALKEAERALIWLDTDPSLYAISDNFNADLKSFTAGLRSWAQRDVPSDTLNPDDIALAKELLDVKVGIDPSLIQAKHQVGIAYQLLERISDTDSRNKKVREVFDYIEKYQFQYLDDNQKQQLSTLIDRFNKLHPAPDLDVPSKSGSTNNISEEEIQQRIADNVNAVTIPQGLVDRFNNMDPEVKDEISKFMEDGNPKALANLSKKARTILSGQIEGKLTDEEDSLDKAERLELFGLYLALKQERIGQNPSPTSLGDGDFLRGVNPKDIEKAASSRNKKLIVNGKYTGYTVKRSDDGGGSTGENETYFVKNQGTGETFIFKYEGEEKNAYTEALAINILNAFGIEGVSFVAPHQDNPNYIVMTFGGANLNLTDVGQGQNYDSDQHSMTEADILQSFLIGMFDATTLNGDRHDQNYLVGLDENGVHVSIPIDHGLVMPYEYSGDQYDYAYAPEQYFYRQPNMLATPVIENMLSNWGPEAVDELVKMSTQQALQAIKRMYPAGQVPKIDILIKRMERLQSRGLA